jgi:CheY-like chemotaxis protein
MSADSPRQVLLLHWNPEEAKERRARLRRAGFQAELFCPQAQSAFRDLRERAPDAFVIDLSRVPSHGRAVATALRQQKATRSIPIVFLGGDPEKVARTRETLPDAVYAGWDNVRSALRAAIENPPREPAVPGTMDAYSASPLTKKLGIKQGSVVLLIGAPTGFEVNLEYRPADVSVLRRAAHARTILLFAKSLVVLEREFPKAAEKLDAGGGIWIVWPKKTSGISSDLSQQGVREFGLARGFVDYKICAIDETWSGLLFVKRRRP